MKNSFAKARFKSRVLPVWNELPSLESSCQLSQETGTESKQTNSNPTREERHSKHFLLILLARGNMSADFGQTLVYDLDWSSARRKPVT